MQAHLLQPGRWENLISMIGDGKFQSLERVSAQANRILALPARRPKTCDKAETDVVSMR